MFILYIVKNVYIVKKMFTILKIKHNYISKLYI